MPSAARLVRALLAQNRSLLSQELGLIDALSARHGAGGGAAAAFSARCPVAGASLGQHLRHLGDHTELAAMGSRDVCRRRRRRGRGGRTDEAEDGGGGVGGGGPLELCYDLRSRGGALETDPAQARIRILEVAEALEEVHDAIGGDRDGGADEALARALADHPVAARFHLTSGGAEDLDEDGPAGPALPSTLARELGFVAHHAVHHLAMARIIATSPEAGGLSASDLPEGFGRAPSTLRHDAAEAKGGG